MNGFERYSLHRWTENGLSVHPPTQPPSEQKRATSRGFLTQIAVPLIALATFGLAEPTPAESVLGSSTFGQTSDTRPRLLVTAQSPMAVLRVSSPPLSPVDAFEAHAAKLLAEIRGGSLTNVPETTLRFASAMVERHAATDKTAKPDWIDKVASEVAKLTD